MSESILITGSRKGIGYDLAVHYLNLGWKVHGCSRTETELHHPNYRHYRVDIADESAVVGMVRAIRKEGPFPYALVNNAGIASMNQVLTTPGKTARGIIDTNFLGTFYLCREAGKQMARLKRGRIVNLSTVAYPMNLEGESVYAASKAAVESLTRILSKELGPFGVTVNALGPTPIDTDLIRGVAKEKIALLLQQQAINRMGKMDDVSNAIDFFLSPKSSFITGQTIYLGGVF